MVFFALFYGEVYMVNIQIPFVFNFSYTFWEFVFDILSSG